MSRYQNLEEIRGQCVSRCQNLEIRGQCVSRYQNLEIRGQRVWFVTQHMFDGVMLDSAACDAASSRLEWNLPTASRAIGQTLVLAIGLWMRFLIVLHFCITLYVLEAKPREY